MNFPAYSRADWHAIGHDRRNANVWPRVLLMYVGRARGNPHPDCVIVHEAGDDYTREVPITDIGALLGRIEPEQAFRLGRAVERSTAKHVDGDWHGTP